MRYGVWARRITAVAIAGSVTLGFGLVWLDHSARVDLERAPSTDPALTVVADRIMQLGTEVLIVSREDVALIERYGDNRRALVPPVSRRYGIASASKAVIGATVIAVGLCDGWLDLDAQVAGLLPKGTRDWGSIRLHDFASHTSGMANAPREGPGSDWGLRFWNDLDARPRIALETAPMTAPPDTIVQYSNPAYAALSIAVATVMHGADAAADVTELLDRNIMRPLRIPPRAWQVGYGHTFEIDGMSYEEIGGGARLTGRALARLGAMIAGRGTWRGREIVPAGCVDTILTPVDDVPTAESDVATSPAPAIGWWSNANGFWPDLPRDLVMAAGADQNVLLVIPSRDLVIVRIGDRLGNDMWAGDYWRRLHDDVVAPVLHAADAATPAAGATEDVPAL